MMSKISTFIAGLAVGGAAVWYYAKRKYAFIAEQEIASVKEAYAQSRPLQEKPASTPAVKLAPGVVQDKPSIVDYAKRVQEAGYTNYSNSVEPKTGVRPGKLPYVISPDEFGESEEYAKVSLTCFADGVLADEYGEVVDNVEEIVGDALEHIGEYEEDCVYVRNDARRCDYEILEDLREFAEFQKALPPNR
ncbi:hypothetical protein D1159_05915 [Pseudoflavonifractor sp. 524-17]|uniref:hypothetical protein n=1 Tax=Pseudoflavonifractor sp. 524-17 TaxID=2304577 RepID=UPI00137A7C21|nr:hypothetical protein [Pseudoflavonifractor sp. 524-17]NCE64134.1 hypothetical protein [Pseudoflavonifractor sp. 524-17]